MSTPYVGEIRLAGFNFAPVGWQFCNGSLLAISQFDVLFNLIGTTYGGDGINTFAVPDLRGRVPVHRGSGFVVGQLGGTETVTLTAAQLPSHTHVLRASTNDVRDSSPVNSVLASNAANSYGAGPTTVAMASSGIAPAVGGGQPHDNMGPYSVANYIISLFGVYPSQS